VQCRSASPHTRHERRSGVPPLPLHEHREHLHAIPALDDVSQSAHQAGAAESWRDPLDPLLMREGLELRPSGEAGAPGHGQLASGASQTSPTGVMATSVRAFCGLR